jgi:hypothetical protein
MYAYHLFSKDAPATRHTKLLANIFYMSNQIGSIVTAAPAYEVSARLTVNVFVLSRCETA